MTCNGLKTSLEKNIASPQNAPDNKHVTRDQTLRRVVRMFPGGRWHIISYKATCIPRFEAVHMPILLTTCSQYLQLHLLWGAHSVVNFERHIPRGTGIQSALHPMGWMIVDKGHVIFPNSILLSFGHVKDTLYNIYIYICMKYICIYIYISCLDIDIYMYIPPVYQKHPKTFLWNSSTKFPTFPHVPPHLPADSNTLIPFGTASGLLRVGDRIPLGTRAFGCFLVELCWASKNDGSFAWTATKLGNLWYSCIIRFLLLV